VSDREIIDKVLRILGSSAPNDAAQHRKLERTIGHGLRYPSKETIASGRYGVFTHKQKKAAARVEAAIHRLQIALRDPNLVRQHTDDARFDADFEAYAARFDASLEALRERYQNDAEKSLQEKRYRAVDWSVHSAARTAAEVCKMCGLPLRLGRDSHFVRITAAICRKEGTDLRKVCDTVARELEERSGAT
jgi:hypothetical protein